MRRRETTFEDLVHGKDPNSKEYREIKARFDEIARQQRAAARNKEYCHRLAVRIVELCKPVQRISVGKINYKSEEHLIAIGTAAKQLYDAMDAAGLIQHDVTRERTGEDWEFTW